MVKNSLVKRGFYNNMNFHRIIKNGWIQTGCPYDLGFGHAGYAVKSEAENQTVLHEAGTVAMSQNLKSGFTGSQFFIDLKRQEAHDKKFTIIGRVPESRMEVVKQIGSVDTDKNTDRPLKEDLKTMKPTPTADDSRAINDVRGACLVMAGAGMCNGGRIRHHLRHHLWQDSTHVVLAGYQAAGTLGRRLVEGEPYVDIFGERIKVAARVHTIGGLSAKLLGIVMSSKKLLLPLKITC